MLVNRKIDPASEANGGVVARRDPWDQMMQDFFGRPGFALRPVAAVRQGAAGFVPALDVSRSGDSVFIRADLPGVRREDVELTVDGDRLTIKGTRTYEKSVEEDERFHVTERSWGEFERSVVLPSDVNPAGAEASYVNGVLEIRLPVAEEARPRKIEIKSN